MVDPAGKASFVYKDGNSFEKNYGAASVGDW